MTVTTNFLWTGTNLGGRSAKAVLRGGDILVPEWDRHKCWFLNPVSLSGAYLTFGITDTAPFYESATGIGYIDGCSDSSGGSLLLSADGRIAYRSSGTSNYVYSGAPSGKIPCKLSYDGTNFLALTSDGAVYKLSAVSTGVQPTFTEVGTFSAYASSFSYYSGSLYATVASAQAYEAMLESSGAVTSVTTPMRYPSAIAPSASGIAVIGLSHNSLPYGYTCIQSSALLPSSLAIGVRSATSNIDVFSGSDYGWTISSTTALAAQGIDGSFTSNDEQILVSLSSGAVEVLNVSSGALTSSQTLTVSGAGSLAITPDATAALVCQNASNEIAVLTNSVNVWSVGTPVTSITAPVDVVCISSTLAAVACGSGIVYLSRLGNIWSVASTVSLPFTASSIFYDVTTANLFVAGTASGSGYLSYIDSSGTLHSADIWTGSGDAVVTLSNRAVVLDATNGQTRLYPTLAVNFANQRAIQTAVLASPTGLFVTNYNFWTTSATAAAGQNLLGINGNLAATRTGAIGVYNGSTWATYSLGVEIIPTALMWDSAGYLWVAASNNTLYQFSSSLSLVSSVAIPAYTNQDESVYLGISSIVEISSTLYCTTSLSGVIVQVSGITL